MNINYQKKMEEEIENMVGTPTLLLHSCCAPCSSYIIEYLSNYFDITIYYYNPNISPIDEYEKRKKEQIKFIREFKTKNKLDIVDSDYNYDDFLNITFGLEEEPEGGKRCHKCYYLRLDNTALKASNLNYNYFTTTLSISPYKNSKLLNEIGEEVGKKYNVKYLYSDFKKKEGYKKSIKLAKQYNLYRQDYCGCIYSKIKSESLKKESLIK